MTAGASSPCLETRRSSETPSRAAVGVGPEISEKLPSGNPCSKQQQHTGASYQTQHESLYQDEHCMMASISDYVQRMGVNILLLALYVDCRWFVQKNNNTKYFLFFSRGFSCHMIDGSKTRRLKLLNRTRVRSTRDETRTG